MYLAFMEWKKVEKKPQQLLLIPFLYWYLTFYMNKNFLMAVHNFYIYHNLIKKNSFCPNQGSNSEIILSRKHFEF